MANATPWFDIALKELESTVREVEGSADNSRILDYLRTTDYPNVGLHDEVPWCSAFVNWCLKEAGIEGTNSAAALSWLSWGRGQLLPEEVVPDERQQV